MPILSRNRVAALVALVVGALLALKLFQRPVSAPRDDQVLNQYIQLLASRLVATTRPNPEQDPVIKEMLDRDVRNLRANLNGLGLTAPESGNLQSRIAPYQDPNVHASSIMVSFDVVQLFLNRIDAEHQERIAEDDRKASAETRKTWIAFAISLLLVPVALVVILSTKDKFTPETKAWAFAALGIVAGFWLK
jgi:hypothetical protein